MAVRNMFGEDDPDKWQMQMPGGEKLQIEIHNSSARLELARARFELGSARFELPSARSELSIARFELFIAILT